MTDIQNTKGVPVCKCGGRIKPDVVLYEEGLNQEILEKAIRAIQQADMLIVGGTSLVVYPASGLIDYYNKNKLVLINKTPTPKDDLANYIFQGEIGTIMASLVF